MLNPHQLADRIDSAIARARFAGEAGIVLEILAGLGADDRRGLDPELLADIVRVRMGRAQAMLPPADAA